VSISDLTAIALCVVSYRAPADPFNSWWGGATWWWKLLLLWKLSASSDSWTPTALWTSAQYSHNSLEAICYAQQVLCYYYYCYYKWFFYSAPSK